MASTVQSRLTPRLRSPCITKALRNAQRLASRAFCCAAAWGQRLWRSQSSASRRCTSQSLTSRPAAQVHVAIMHLQQSVSVREQVAGREVDEGEVFTLTAGPRDVAAARCRLRAARPSPRAATARNTCFQSLPAADQNVSCSRSPRRSVPSRSTTRVGAADCSPGSFMLPGVCGDGASSHRIAAVFQFGTPLGGSRPGETAAGRRRQWCVLRTVWPIRGTQAGCKRRVVRVSSGPHEPKIPHLMSFTLSRFSEA
jgi:hypothetical protein